MKSRGLEGVVDMRPRRMLSSYDPTIEVWCKGEDDSSPNEGRLENAELCGDDAPREKVGVDVRDLLGWWAW